ncbi:MAG: methionyl-tRNA formyltransferase [Myxococcota bacterium]|jgi:methionyl-tRNA formyltransferase
MGLRLALFGQAPFGREVTEGLAQAGHTIVAVYCPPEGSRPDPLAQLAEENGWPLFRYKRFRSKGAAIPEIVDEYRELGVDLNVLPFTTAILPNEITDAPEHGSLCFHPSLLPAYRGGAALAWQIILGAKESGVSVFKVTEGVDAGPLVVQRGGVEVAPNETMASLYFDKLYPLGVTAMLDAVAAVDNGTARYTEQDEQGASEQGLINDEAARIDWKLGAALIDQRIRGCDPSPGAIAELNGDKVRLFGARPEAVATDASPGTVLSIQGGAVKIACGDGSVWVEKARTSEGKKAAAAELGVAEGDCFA